MPRNYLSARGEVVDFDMQVIKQQLATAPMTVDVEKRKTFIESKEVRKKPEVASEIIATPMLDVLDAEPEVAPKKKK